MDKLGRNYILEIETSDGGKLTVKLPFTIEFDITRNTLTSANVCKVRIFNLSLLNRNQIQFNAADYGTFRGIKLQAGYGGNLAVIFQGNMSEAFSVREGVDFVTQIECYDGGFAFANGQINQQFAAGTRFRDVVSAIMKGLPRVTIGAIGSYPGEILRGNTYSGNAAAILADITGGGLFVDGGKAHALGTNEFIAAANGTTVITSQSGLLGTPVVEQTIVRFDMLFEPGLNVGQRILLDSITGTNFNGFYKLTGVKHRGMISESVCGSVITTGEFFYSKILRGV